MTETEDMGERNIAKVVGGIMAGLTLVCSAVAVGNCQFNKTLEEGNFILYKALLGMF